MRNFFVALSLFAGLMLAVGGTTLAATTDGPVLDDAAALFTGSKCTKCHSIKSKGIPAKKPGKKSNVDLSKVKEDAAFLTKYLKKEVIGGKKEKKHKKAWKGSDEDLAKLIKWIKS